MNCHLIDTHAHIDGRDFQSDFSDMLKRARTAGLTRIITVGADLESSRAAAELARSHDHIFCAVGIHPHEAARVTEKCFDLVRDLATGNPKVVAIGEIGLDYYWHKVDHEVQARAFRAQLELAAELRKPVIIHSREAAADVIELLEEFAKQADCAGTLHSYFDDLAIAQRAFAIGFYIGVTGPITFKKAEREREIIQQVPLERVLVETDAPFLTPVPHRGERNEPAFVSHTAAMIAKVCGLSIETVARQTTHNAEKLFGWQEV